MTCARLTVSVPRHLAPPSGRPTFHPSKTHFTFTPSELPCVSRYALGCTLLLFALVLPLFLTHFIHLLLTPFFFLPVSLDSPAWCADITIVGIGFQQRRHWIKKKKKLIHKYTNTLINLLIFIVIIILLISPHRFFSLCPHFSIYRHDRLSL